MNAHTLSHRPYHLRHRSARARNVVRAALIAALAAATLAGLASTESLRQHSVFASPADHGNDSSLLAPR